MSVDGAAAGSDLDRDDLVVMRATRVGTGVCWQLDRLERQLRRLALDIHDTLAQSLCAARLQIATIDLLGVGEAQRAQLQVLRQLIDSATRDVNELVSDLRPSAVDADGLCGKIVHYCDDLRERAGLVVDLHCEGDAPDLTPSAEIAVFRIVQESLNNVRKHAGVDRAEVTLTFEAREMRCAITDHGRGFDPSAPVSAGRGNGHGMAGMHERAALLGGDVEVIASPGGGTTVRVRIPVWQP